MLYVGFQDPLCSRYKESINDCTAALDVQPNYFKALCRRAKAYENLGLYKQALSDIQKANKTEQVSSETQVMLAARLRVILGLSRTDV
jgi:tetratricopeptide (TPR) repeat protein